MVWRLTPNREDRPLTLPVETVFTTGCYASLYHGDGVWVLWTGDVWTGRRAIEEGHAAVHKTTFVTAFKASTSKS